MSADCVHVLVSQWYGKMAGEIADFSSFSFHTVKNYMTEEDVDYVIENLCDIVKSL